MTCRGILLARICPEESFQDIRRQTSGRLCFRGHRRPLRPGAHLVVQLYADNGGAGGRPRMGPGLPPLSQSPPGPNSQPCRLGPAGFCPDADLGDFSYLYRTKTIQLC